MAAKEKGLDGFEAPETNDTRGINLDAGESYVGEITSYKPWAGDYGLIEIDGETVFLNKTMQSQLIAGLVTGNEVAFCKSEDEESFEDEDGKKVTYNPKELRFKDGGN